MVHEDQEAEETWGDL